MVSQESIYMIETEFAKKCRLALEKSFGGTIPKPKFPKKQLILKRTRAPK
jgi:hypothetical protein